MPAPVDLAHYDLLGVEPNATQLEIKQSYRKLAVIHHPDKNPGDETANARFQAIGEAYQILSNPELRANYDKHGKDATPPDGFQDPHEFFSHIFGGEGFKEYIGEIALMKDLTDSMAITGRNLSESDQEEEDFPGTRAAKKETADSNVQEDQDRKRERSEMEADKKQRAKAEKGGFFRQGSKSPPASTTPDSPEVPSRPGTSGSTSDQRQQQKPTPAPAGPSNTSQIPIRAAIKNKAEADEDEPEEDAIGKKKKKKEWLTKEQRTQLAELEKAKAAKRKQRIAELSASLIRRVSLYTESDKAQDVVSSFEEKIRLEVENLKMESFGLDICHAIGYIYMSKALAVMNSKQYFGMGSIFTRAKDKVTFIKDTWNTITTAIDAQMMMEDMARMEKEGGDTWTDEKKAEYERLVTGSVLNAAWKGSRFEITSVLREVCDEVLNDKTVTKAKRLERAEGLYKIGVIFSRAARTKEEEDAGLAFEQLVADAAARKHEKKDKKGKDKKDAHAQADALSDVPNLPKSA